MRRSRARSWAPVASPRTGGGTGPRRVTGSSRPSIDSGFRAPPMPSSPARAHVRARPRSTQEVDVTLDGSDADATARVGIVVGSRSDIAAAERAMAVLDELG